MPQEHSLFRGLGNGKFADVSRDAGPVLEVKTVARGACFADYDNDGKVDAFLVNLGAPATLLHNVSQNSQSLAHGEAEGEEEQSRRHRRAVEVLARWPKADRRTRCRLRLSFAGRWPRSFRPGRGHESRQAHDSLAERPGPGSGESAVDRVLTVEEPKGAQTNSGSPCYLPAAAEACGVLAVTLLAIAAKPAAKQSGALVKEHYLSPIEMAFPADGHRLYVVVRGQRRSARGRSGSATVVGIIHGGAYSARHRSLARWQADFMWRTPGPIRFR